MSRPKWRKMTWVVVIFNVLILIWIIGGVNDATNDCAPGDQLCEDASAVGAGIGVGIILVFAALGNIILGIIWLVTRPDQRSVRVDPKTTRECPHCKEKMRRDASVCPHCQRDSEPWKFHEGKWWTRSGETWFWLDPKGNQWHQAQAPPPPPST